MQSDSGLFDAMVKHDALGEQDCRRGIKLTFMTPLPWPISSVNTMLRPLQCNHLATILTVFCLSVYILVDMNTAVCFDMPGWSCRCDVLFTCTGSQCHFHACNRETCQRFGTFSHQALQVHSLACHLLLAGAWSVFGVSSAV